MSTPTKKQTNWIQYVGFAILILVLFFTDLGVSVRGGIQHLLLKTGIKDAPVSSTPIPPPDRSVMGGYPYQLTLNALDGKQIQLRDLTGKVVFLNQWATWCPPCRAEMPAIEKLYQSMDTSKVAFVMLSLDEDSQKVQQLVDKHQFTFPIYVPGSQLPEAFNTQAIPTTLILNSDGQIAKRIEGMANYDTDEFRQYLLSLYNSAR